MTRYAIDQRRHGLMATWRAGRGEVTEALAALPASASLPVMLDLAGALTRLSAAVWRCYTQPAPAADRRAPASEGRRRQAEHDEFAKVTVALQAPNLPTDAGLVQCYDPVEERSHQVGRALHAIADAAVTAAVVADVEQELETVARAERGDLTGRAAQAVALTREYICPIQVAEANRVLTQDPLDDAQLLARFDPAAASVAAAHWLHAAAAVAAEQAGMALAEVVYTADNRQALPTATPILVLNLIESGLRPLTVVRALVGAAMLVAEGRAPAAAWQAAGIDPQAVEFAHRATDGEGELLTTLDPSRPAPDLLEDLLSAVDGCWELFAEDFDDFHAHGAEPGDGGEGEELTAQQMERMDAQARAAFVQAVRQRADANRNRLL